MIPNRDIATAASSDLVLSHITSALHINQPSLNVPGNAIVPIFGIRMPSQVIRRVGPRELTAGL